MEHEPEFTCVEAEQYAVIDGASRAHGMQTAAEQPGTEVEALSVATATDSTGAKAFASRRGWDRVRQVEYAWLNTTVFTCGPKEKNL